MGTCFLYTPSYKYYNLTLTDNFKHLYNLKASIYYFHIGLLLLQTRTPPNGGFERFYHVNLTSGYILFPKLWYTNTHTHTASTNIFSADGQRF